MLVAAFSLGLLAREINQKSSELKDELFSLSLFLIVGGIVIGSSIFIYLILVHKSHAKFMGIIEGGIVNVIHRLYSEEPKILPLPKWKEEDFLRKSLEQVDQEIQYTRNFAEISVLSTSLEEAFPQIFEAIKKILPADRLALAFKDQFGNVVAESAVTNYNQIHLEPGFTQPLSESTLSGLASSGQPRIINSLSEHIAKRPDSVCTKLILMEGMNSSLTLPLMIRGHCVGFLFVNSKDQGAYNNAHVRTLRRMVGVLKPQLYFQHIVQIIVSETSNAFVKIMEKKDNETSLHIIRMSQYSHILAKKMYMKNSYPGHITPRTLREILWFAPLHDIGKIGVPDQILMKPGPLTPEEFHVMKAHVTMGESVLRSLYTGINKYLFFSLLNTAIDILSSHHEKWDGTGYPRGLQKEEIPLSARIVAVADVFDALTSRRPYKEAWSLDKTFNYIVEQKSHQFDPLVVEAFLEARIQIEEVYEKYKEV